MHTNKITVMGLSALHLKLALLACTLAAASAQSKAGCVSRCGNLSIPYPFGTTENCSRDPNFHITCTSSSGNPIPYLTERNIQVLNISLYDGEMRVSTPIGYDCYRPNVSSYPVKNFKQTQNFPISTRKNMFTLVGCDTMAYIRESTENKLDGCQTSSCSNLTSVPTGFCSGAGCCQTTFDEGIKNYTFVIHRSISNQTDVLGLNRCSYAFLAENQSFHFSFPTLHNLSNKTTFPLVLNWAIDNHTCDQAKKNTSSYACMHNSKCSESESGIGYLCKCEDGFQGNPYLSDPVFGCKGHYILLPTPSDLCFF